MDDLFSQAPSYSEHSHAPIQAKFPGNSDLPFDKKKNKLLCNWSFSLILQPHLVVSVMTIFLVSESIRSGMHPSTRIDSIWTASIYGNSIPLLNLPTPLLDDPAVHRHRRSPNSYLDFTVIIASLDFLALSCGPFGTLPM